MPVLLLLLLLVVAIVAPGLWVKRILQRYSRPADRYAGSGGELARHMLDCIGEDLIGRPVGELLPDLATLIVWVDELEETVEEISLARAGEKRIYEVNLDGLVKSPLWG